MIGVWFWMLAAAGSEGIDVTSFDCAQASAILGFPGAEVVSCVPFHGSPALWYVWLTTPKEAVRRFVLPGEPPFTGQGLAAAGRFLEEGQLDANRKLDAEAALMFLKAAGARPPGWTEMDGADDSIVRAPSVVQSPAPGVSFTAAPFRLTMIRGIRASVPGSLPSPGLGGGSSTPGGPGGPGGGWSPPVIAGYERAVLARSRVGGTWEWQLASWVDGEWEEASRVPLR